MQQRVLSECVIKVLLLPHVCLLKFVFDLKTNMYTNSHMYARACTQMCMHSYPKSVSFMHDILHSHMQAQVLYSRNLPDFI